MLWNVTAEYHWRSCESQTYELIVKADTEDEAIDKAEAYVAPKTDRESFSYKAIPLDECFNENGVAEIYYDYFEK